MLILPPEKKSNIGQNNPENRQNLGYARGPFPLLLCFWERHPALFFGFAYLLGTAAAFRATILFSGIFLLLLLSFSHKAHQLIALLLFATALFSTPLRHPQITLPQQKISGTAHFHIETIKTQASAFHHSLLCKGTLITFIDPQHPDQPYKNLPCHLYLPLNAKLPQEHCDYAIEGALTQKDRFLFVFKPDKHKSWKPIPDTHTWAFIRHQLHKSLKQQIKKKIPDKRAQTLLSALATGEIDERLLSLEFGKIGLQHILAISGFHFALIVLFLKTLLRCCLPLMISHICLLLALTAYYFFLGNAPSIQRAYIVIILSIFGTFFSFSISALNALGIALLAEVASYPLCVTELSFQLTFLCTLGILLFYAPMHALCKKGFPERTQEQTQQLTHLEKYGHVLSSLIRKSLAINLSVTIISLPVLLHLFHKFPLLSLFYNLFFPACICISMLLLCSALLLTPIFPFLSHALHAINNLWTASLLKITAHTPAALDFVVRTHRLSFTSTCSLVTGGIFLAILFHEKKRLSKHLL